MLADSLQVRLHARHTLLRFQTSLSDSITTALWRGFPTALPLVSIIQTLFYMYAAARPQPTYAAVSVCVCVCVLRRLQITAYCRAARHTAGVQLRGRFAFTTHVPELPADYGKR